MERSGDNSCEGFPDSEDFKFRGLAGVLRDLKDQINGS